MRFRHADHRERLVDHALGQRLAAMMRDVDPDLLERKHGILGNGFSRTRRDTRRNHPERSQWVGLRQQRMLQQRRRHRTAADIRGANRDYGVGSGHGEGKDMLFH